MSVSSNAVRSSSKKPPRRGLKKAVWDVLDKGLAPPVFGVAEIKKGLNSKGWVHGVQYDTNSMVHAIKDLIVEGCVAWVVNVPRNADKVWSYTPAHVSSLLNPCTGTVDKMIEELSDEIVSRVRQRAKEKLGI